MSISYITYKEIDKKKWDDCIHGSLNGLIYARSFYLDAMAENWDAIVLNDYEAVMPLTWKTKWGIRYIYQPAFIQQAGIFFTKLLDENDQQSFIDLALQKFKFAETTLNFSNNIKFQHEKIVTTDRTNFVVSLAGSYDDLYKKYDASFTKSLRRIKKFEMRYEPSVNYHDSIQLYKELYGKRLPFFTVKSYEGFENICAILSKSNDVIIRDARNKDGQLLASVILLRDAKRLYNMISCITVEGKKWEANYFLYDRIVHEFAGKDLLLDLEGSDVKGIAAFYKKFNPVNQPYPFIRFNNLPPLMKIFKP